MVNLLPAVLIGGPPHAGKSVLFYSLTSALRECGVRHHAIRACPDGEGNWYQELDQEAVSHIRQTGKWTEGFVSRICQDLERRHLPLLVDMGGRPKESQHGILRQCTHALLLLRRDMEEDTRRWRQFVDTNGLVTLASVYSEVSGPSMITSQVPIIEGTITGLERNLGASAHGALFDALVERIAVLFKSYSSEQEKALLDKAPTELVVNLYLSLQALDPQAVKWELSMLQPLLAGLPPNVPLSVYGQAPHWLYAALLVHAGKQPFYQFDPRLGWIDPLPLQISTSMFPDIEVQLHEDSEQTVLSVNIVPQHLDYFQPEPLPFPTIPTKQGVILYGRMPSWLVTGLVRLYNTSGVAWIACYQPQAKGAVVVASRTSAYVPGDLVPPTQF